MTEEDHPTGDLEYDPRTDRYQTTYSPADESPSAAVVKTLAAVRRRDPVEIDPLYEFVDTDALDTILHRDDCSSVSISFEVDSFVVTIDSGGRIEIQPPEGPD